MSAPTCTLAGGLYERARKQFKLDSGIRLFYGKFHKEHRYDAEVNATPLPGSRMQLSFRLCIADRQRLNVGSLSSPTFGKKLSMRGLPRATRRWRLSHRPGTPRAPRFTMQFPAGPALDTQRHTRTGTGTSLGPNGGPDARAQASAASHHLKRGRLAPRRRRGLAAHH